MLTLDNNISWKWLLVYRNVENKLLLKMIRKNLYFLISFDTIMSRKVPVNMFIFRNF
jgi:hypothetical protein